MLVVRSASADPASMVERPDASAPDATDGQARSEVDVTIAGDAASATAMEDVLRERVTDSGASARFERAERVDAATVVTPTDDDAHRLARVWVDLTPEDHVALYLVDGTWERVLVRRVQRTDNPEVAREEIGHIVELSLAALRAGELIGIDRATARAELLPAPPPPAPPPPPPPEEDSPPPPPRPPARADFELAGAVFYGLRAHGNGPELQHSAGVLLEGERRTKRRFPSTIGGALVGELRFPATVDTPHASLELSGTALMALATAGAELSSSSQLTVALGGGVQIVREEATGDYLGVRFASAQNDVLPSLRALGRYDWKTSVVRLFAGLGVDVSFGSVRYLAVRDDQSVVLFAPWVAQPFSVLGIETP